MHTQTESTQVLRRGRALPSAAVGLVIYLLTLAVEVLCGASVRWLLVYLGAATLGMILPLGLSAEVLAWIAAAAPLAHSALGLALPGRGRLWRRRLGARWPTAEETAALEAALELLRSADAGLRPPVRWFVLDEPLPAAAVRGRVLILSRSLLESEGLTPVLAHELGHAETIDGRLTEALDRLALWADPLDPARFENGGDVDLDPRGGLLWSALRWTLRLAGGSIPQRLLGPLWAAHWRAREYAADAYAASLGMAEELINHLGAYEQLFDAPQAGLLFNLVEHPPVALRIERLRAFSNEVGSK